MRMLGLVSFILAASAVPAQAAKMYLWLGPAQGAPALVKQFEISAGQRRAFSFRFESAAWRAEVRAARPAPFEAAAPGTLDFSVRLHRGGGAPVAVYEYHGRDGMDDCGTSPSVRAGRLWIVLGVGFTAPPTDRCASIVDYVRRHSD